MAERTPPIPVFAHGAAAEAARDEAERLVAGHAGLDDVVRGGVRIAEVVKQDEYTHDVLVPFRGGLWLVYDTT
jgi:hypothetical protein